MNDSQLCILFRFMLHGIFFFSLYTGFHLSFSEEIHLEVLGLFVVAIYRSFCFYSSFICDLDLIREVLFDSVLFI